MLLSIGVVVRIMGYGEYSTQNHSVLTMTFSIIFEPLPFDVLMSSIFFIRDVWPWFY